MMPGFVGPGDLLVLLIVALLLFGPQKLPQIGRSVGRGLREFRETFSGEHRDVTEEPRALPVAHDDARRILDHDSIA